ncbi:MAG: DUF2235 domain-containing protein, partial [Burkholderiaceae bacterium]|nr:DUF2235 domain-containing protein [Burkholderiaceae bacterium]
MFDATNPCSFSALRVAFRALSAIVLPAALACAAASPLPARADAPGMCTPAGGAPGSPARIELSIGGAIGAGVGGSGVDAFVAQFAGGSPPVSRSPCQDATAPGVLAPLALAAADAPHGEPASIAEAGVDRLAGNPVDVASGNKYQRQLDVVLPHLESSTLSPAGLAAAFGLPSDESRVRLFARHYNSRSDFALSLGRGWSHSFETRLARILRGGRVELQVVQADGRRLVFRERSVAGASVRSYAGSQLADGLIEEHPDDAAARFSWRWPGGRRIVFDDDGRLASIVATDLDTIRLRRDESGRLLEAIDAAGRSFGFRYEGSRLRALQLPDGQQVVYDYDSHGQLALVRYPDGRTQRYHYEDPRAFHLLTGITDSDGRRSHHEYDEALRVRLSRGIGQGADQALHFAYRLPRKAGQVGLTTITVAGRASRFRWLQARNDTGAALLDAEGAGCAQCPPIGLRVRLDRHGRSVELGSMRLDYDAEGRVRERRLVDAKGRTQWSERLRYGDVAPLSKPVAIERDSVVPGRTLQLSLRYTPAGRLARIAATGFAPGAQGAEAISAAMSFQYAGTGPAAGRLVSLMREASAGAGMRSTFVYDPQRRLVLVGNGAQLLHRIERDALGRAVSEQLPDGVLRTRRFDAAWRLASSSAHGRTVRFEYDAAGRPSTLDWSDGERWSITLLPGALEIASNHGWRQRVVPGAQASTTSASGSRERRFALPVAVARAHFGRQVLVDAMGQGSEFLRDDFGRVVEIRSAHAVTRRQRYDGLGRLSAIEYADGSRDLREHDTVGRIVRREQVAGDERIETRFGYQQARLVSIEHPEQGSFARYDEAGRLAELVHERGTHSYRQAFEYDAAGRLSGHRLADGSRLLYQYDAQGRPVRLGLVLGATGATRWLVDQVDHGVARLTTLRLGNGIRFERRDDPSGRPLSLSWQSGSAASSTLPFRRLRWHASGLPVSVSHEFGEDRYAYDRFGRLIARERHGLAGAAVSVPGHVEYFALDPAGRRLAVRRRDGSDWRSDAGAHAAHDLQGRPMRHGSFALRYGAQQRLVEARAARVAVRYRYDAFGQRASRSDQVGSKGFLHHDHRLVGETDGEGRLLRQYLYWDERVIAILDHDPRGERPPTLTWLHGDHLGTPVAASDEAGRTVWQGDADAFGRLAHEQGEFEQPLRLPGQYRDPATGLHDNLLRTYDPDAGRYLEPDPLGLVAGLDPFAYADGNPLVAADPLGLILFAFDGTGNGATRQGRQDISNVRKFFEQYDDPHKWYMAGVGRNDFASGIAGGVRDLLDAGSARARVDWMLNTLDGFLSDAWAGRTVPIDVIGFSRGAAMARDFVNRVSGLVASDYYSTRGICVDLRFLGLWDTVAQFGPFGRDNRSWMLAVPSAVRATFHAVALNEHRRLFPLESALGGEAWVIERGFIGDHSDIGGGNSEGDLSDVTLAWMVNMAASVGLPMRELPDEQRRVAAPLVHDRTYLDWGDRAINQRDS